MKFKDVLFLAGCAVVWLVILPLLALAAISTLVGYAMCSELADLIRGNAAHSPQQTKAREIAARMCVGR